MCNSWQFWSSQLIQSHYNLILHILHYIMLHTLLKTVQLLWILFKDFFPQLVHLIQLLLMKTKQTTKYTLVIAFLAFGGSKRCLFLFFLILSGLCWVGRNLLCQLACSQSIHPGRIWVSRVMWWQYGVIRPLEETVYCWTLLWTTGRWWTATALAEA